MTRAALCGLMVACWLAAVAQAQTPAFSKVTLAELHCASCAKEVAKHVVAVPGVAEVRYDLKAKSIWAIHKPGMTPSPRGLWEAVERADQEVQRLQTPSATYTSKPAT